MESSASATQPSMPAPLYTNTWDSWIFAMSLGEGSHSWGSVPAGTRFSTSTWSPPTFCAKSAMG